MHTPLRSSRPSTLAAFCLTSALAFLIMAGPARCDDGNDPVVLKKRIAELEAKVADLQKQVDNAGVGELTAAEKAKFNALMDAIPAEDKLEIAEYLGRMSAEKRLAATRKLLVMTPADFMREKKRNQATRTLEDLRLIDSATDQYAIDTNRTTGMHPSWADLKAYLKSGTRLYTTGADVFGHAYGPFTVDSIPEVSHETFNALSDVADAEFWSPFGTNGGAK